MSLVRGLRTEVAAAWSGAGSPVTRGLLVGLTPLEWAFRAVVSARNRWYRTRSGTTVDIPVVSVGNLTVGGTGKTPVIRALWQWFSANGHAAAVVTRGYGADEVELYTRWFGAGRVFRAPDRIEGVRRAASDGLAVALVDDGFQRRGLERQLDLLLVAAEAPFPARMLPRGPYREPLEAARRASLVLLTSRSGPAPVQWWVERLSAVAPDVPVQAMPLGCAGWMTLEGDPSPPPSGDVLVVASTAAPWSVRETCQGQLPDARTELAPFPDHHDYTAADAARLLARAGARQIVTTEKDAVKLVSFPALQGRVHVLDFRVLGPLPESLTSRLERILPGAEG